MFFLLEHKTSMHFHCQIILNFLLISCSVASLGRKSFKLKLLSKLFFIMVRGHAEKILKEFTSVVTSFMHIMSGKV